MSACRKTSACLHRRCYNYFHQYRPRGQGSAKANCSNPRAMVSPCGLRSGGIGYNRVRVSIFCGNVNLCYLESSNSLAVVILRRADSRLEKSLLFWMCLFCKSYFHSARATLSMASHSMSVLRGGMGIGSESGMCVGVKCFVRDLPAKGQMLESL